MEAQKNCPNGKEAIYINLNSSNKLNPFVCDCCIQGLDRDYLFLLKNFEDGTFDTDESMLLQNLSNSKFSTKFSLYNQFLEKINNLVMSLKKSMEEIEELRDRDSVQDEKFEILQENKENCKFIYSIWKKDPSAQSLSAYKTNLKNYITSQIQYKQSRTQFDIQNKKIEFELKVKSEILQEIINETISNIEITLKKSFEPNNMKLEIFEKLSQNSITNIQNEFSFSQNQFGIFPEEQVLLITSLTGGPSFYPKIEIFDLEANEKLQTFPIQNENELLMTNFTNILTKLYCVPTFDSNYNKIFYMQWRIDSKNVFVFLFDKQSRNILPDYRKIDIGFGWIMNFNYSLKHQSFLILLNEKNGVLIFDINTYEKKDEIKNFNNFARNSCFYDDDQIIIGEPEKYHLYNLETQYHKAFPKPNYDPISMKIVSSRNLLFSGSVGNLRIYSLSLKKIDFFKFEKEIATLKNICKIDVLNENFIAVCNSSKVFNFMNIDSFEVQKREYNCIVDGIFDFELDVKSKVLILKDGGSKQNCRYHMIK